MSTTAVFEVLLEAAQTAVDLIEGINQIQPVQATADTAAFLRQALAAASAGMSSNALAESIRRGLINVPTSIEATVNTPPTTPGLQERLHAIATTARTSPLGIDEAVQVLVDTIELAVGAITNNPATIPANSTSTGIIDLTISDIHRSIGAKGFDLVGNALSGLNSATGILAIARDTLAQGRIALRSTVRAIGDPNVAPATVTSNRNDVMQRVSAADNAITIANAAMNPCHRRRFRSENASCSAERSMRRRPPASSRRELAHCPLSVRSSLSRSADC